MTYEEPGTDQPGGSSWGGGRFRRSHAADDRWYVEDTKSMSTPAHGDAYDFTIDVHCRWSDGRHRPNRILRSAAKYEEGVWTDIEMAVRDVLRRFPPNKPADAEQELNRRLAVIAEGSVDGNRLTWSARAEVSLHPDVRAEEQEGWKRQLQQVLLRSLAQEILGNYETLAGSWRKLLTKVGIGGMEGHPPPYIGRYLVALAANPEKAADIVRELSTHREKKDDELLKKVIDAVNSTEHADINLLEFETAQDTALRRLMEWAGLYNEADDPRRNANSRK